MEAANKKTENDMAVVKAGAPLNLIAPQNADVFELQTEAQGNESGTVEKPVEQFEVGASSDLLTHAKAEIFELHSAKLDHPESAAGVSDTLSEGVSRVPVTLVPIHENTHSDVEAVASGEGQTTMKEDLVGPSDSMRKSAHEAEPAEVAKGEGAIDEVAPPSYDEVEEGEVSVPLADDEWTEPRPQEPVEGDEGLAESAATVEVIEPPAPKVKPIIVKQASTSGEGTDEYADLLLNASKKKEKTPVRKTSKTLMTESDLQRVFEACAKEKDTQGGYINVMQFSSIWRAATQVKGNLFLEMKIFNTWCALIHSSLSFESCLS